jgi:hypothetical protein
MSRTQVLDKRFHLQHALAFFALPAQLGEQGMLMFDTHKASWTFLAWDAQVTLQQPPHESGIRVRYLWLY